MTDFMGFPRPDGSVGIRNHVIILGIGLRGMSVGHRVAGMVKGGVSLLPGENDENSWLGAARHPNVVGMVVVGEGLDREEIDAFVSNLERTGKPHHLVELREAGPVEAVSMTVLSAVEMIRDVSTQRRELTRLSRLLPALYPVRDSPSIGVLKAFVQLLMDENGRCLWIGKEGGDSVASDPNLRKGLKGKFSPGQDAGIYQYSGPHEDASIWKSLLRCGTQLVIHPAEKGRYLSHPLMPVVNVALDDPGRAEETVELDLGRLKDGELRPEAAAISLLTETLAIASGKLTQDEVLEDRVFVL